MEIITKLNNDVNFLGNFSSHIIKDSTETYVILPSIKNPRWFIPIDNKKILNASFAIYQPSLIRARLLKRLSIFGSKIGLFNLIAKKKVYFYKDDRPIKKIFKRDDLHYAFFTGTEGSHRKVTIQVMDESGTILGYIKVSDNEDIDRLLKNEAEILKDLLRLEIRSGLFPKVIYQGHINDVNILVLDTLKSVHSKFRSSLSNSHIEFLGEIFQKTRRHCKFGESGFGCDLRERIRGSVTNSQRDTYEQALAYIEEKIGDREIPFGLCHRDFTPWNTFFHNNKLYAFDWEYAQKDYPPLFDIFHFIIQDGILVRHLKPDGLLKRVFSHRRLLETYCDLIGTNKDFLIPLLLLYLLDISLLYIEREKGELPINTVMMLNIWKKMTNMVVNNL